MSRLNIILIGLCIGLIYKLNIRLDRVSSSSLVALYGTYCNSYRNRALEHFVRKRNWNGFEEFSAPCNLQNAADVYDAVKYRGLVVDSKYFLHSYDSFYTTLGSSSNTKEQLKARTKEISEAIKKEMDND